MPYSSPIDAKFRLEFRLEYLSYGVQLGKIIGNNWQSLATFVS